MQKKILLILFLALALCFAAGCISEETAETGDTVSVYYTLTLDDGTIRDSNVGKTPLSFEIGSGQVVSGFNDAVIGMKVGETKKVRLAPSEAYGEITEDMVQKMLISEIVSSLGKMPEKGDVFMVTVTAGNGIQYPMYAKIMDIQGENAVIALMPSALTGEYLTFEITLDSIVR